MSFSYAIKQCTIV